VNYITVQFLFITLSFYIEAAIVQRVDLLQMEFLVKASRSFHHSTSVISSFSMISALVVMMMMMMKRRNGICIVIICLMSVHELILQERVFFSYDMKEGKSFYQFSSG